MRKWELIVVDMDETLLTSKWAISEANKEAILYAAKSGLKIAIASGRMPSALQNHIDNLSVVNYVISYHGSLLLDSSTNTLLYQTPITKEGTIELQNFLSLKGYLGIFFTKNNLYASQEDEVIHHYVRRTGAKVHLYGSYEELRERGIFKAIVYDPKVRYEPRETDSERFLYKEATYLNSPALKVYKTGLGYIEFTNPNASKLLALRMLSKIININLKNAMAIGDSYNDIDMLKGVGLGIAVANAPEAVKQIAKLQVRSNDENGVAEAIHNLLSGVYDAISL